MKYIADTTKFQLTEPTIVTLGKFDGRHRGHQKLLRTMKALKEKRAGPQLFYVFHRPAAWMKGEPETVITTSMERRRNMEKMDIDYLVEYPFDDQVRHMEPEEFVRTSWQAE